MSYADERLCNKLEFLGQIMDEIDDFLEERGVHLPESDKELMEDNRLDDYDYSRPVLYGTDYGDLSNRIECVLNAWRVFEG